MMGKEKMPNFGDLARNTPPLSDYLHSYSYQDSMGGGNDQPTTTTTTSSTAASLQPRHNQITAQYSSSTDEGCCDTDHGGEQARARLVLLPRFDRRSFPLFAEMDENQSSAVPMPIQRLNSYASSSSSSGVVTNFHSKSLSQNSSRSNFSTFESLDFNLSDCGDLAGSLPSCATTTVATAVCDLNKDDAIISSSNISPSVFVSMSAKSACLFARHNPLNATTHHHHQHAPKMGCRSATRSPIDFR